MIIGGVMLVILLAATIVFTTGDKMTNRERGLLQFIFFAAGAVVAVDVGRQSIKAGARDLLRAHGKKAVRRIVTLAGGLQDLASVIQKERSRIDDRSPGDETVSASEIEGTLDTLEMQTRGQLRMVADAIEDWRDVVPEDVEELEKRSIAGRDG
jgi:hypothetical protein